MDIAAGKYYTIREAAEKLNVNPRTVNRWIHKSRIDAVKLPGRAGGEFRISVAEVDRLLGAPPADEYEVLRAERNRLRSVLQSVLERRERAIYVSGKGYEIYLDPELAHQIEDILSAE